MKFDHYDVMKEYVFDEDVPYAENVERGRRLLDEKYGSALWRNPLLKNPIRFYNTRKCVLGLIFQEYHTGIRILGLDKYATKPSGSLSWHDVIWDSGIRGKAIYYGFCENTSSEDAALKGREEEEKLSRAWKLMLEKETLYVVAAFPQEAAALQRERSVT